MSRSGSEVEDFERRRILVYLLLKIGKDLIKAVDSSEPLKPYQDFIIDVSYFHSLVRV